MAEKVDDFNEPTKKRAKLDPALSNGLFSKEKLEDFSDEILLKVFGYVDTIDQLRLQQVNKRFRAICQDQELCQRVEINCQFISRILQLQLSSEFIQKQLDRGCKYLNLTGCILRNLQLQQPSKLEQLNLSRVDFDERSTTGLLSPCHSLQKLTFKHLTFRGTDVSMNLWFMMNQICIKVIYKGVLKSGQVQNTKLKRVLLTTISVTNFLYFNFQDFSIFTNSVGHLWLPFRICFVQNKP